MSRAINEKLAKELDALGLKNMAAKARVGYYSDFENTIAFPKVQLVNDLQVVGQNDLVRRVIDGEFDG